MTIGLSYGSREELLHFDAVEIASNADVIDANVILDVVHVILKHQFTSNFI